MKSEDLGRAVFSWGAGGLEVDARDFEKLASERQIASDNIFVTQRKFLENSKSAPSRKP